MTIGKLQKLTLTDYPQKLACKVFLVGCNFRCPACCNPELILEKEIEKHSFLKEKDFFNFLRFKKGWLDGVCIGGSGEATLQKDLPWFCRKIKSLGYQVKLDTNGSNPQMLNDLIAGDLVDYVALDIKAPKDKYSRAIGFGDSPQYYLLQKIEKSIKLLKEDRVDYEFKTVVVPKILSRNDILKIVRWLEPAKKYVLENFIPERTIDPEFENIKPYPEDFLFSLRETISPFFEVVEVR